MTLVNKMDQEQFFTYIVRCADESLYCGWTTDIKKRLDAHNGVIKGGAKYTKCRRPVYLVYHESFQSKQEAQSREYAIKHLNRAQKLQLIASCEDREKERINLLKWSVQNIQNDPCLCYNILICYDHGGEKHEAGSSIRKKCTTRYRWAGYRGGINFSRYFT